MAKKTKTAQILEKAEQSEQVEKLYKIQMKKTVKRLDGGYFTGGEVYDVDRFTAHVLTSKDKAIYV